MIKEEEDNFKPVFKYFKSKVPPPCFDKVLSLDRRCTDEDNHDNAEFRMGLKKTEDWISPTCLESGLIIQPNPFTERGKLEWALACLRDYTKNPPHKTNLQETCNFPWSQRLQNPLLYASKLRWSTLGFHHNWDTKEYNLSQCEGEMPSQLSKISSYLVKTILKVNHFTPQAAIVNFYPLNATLSPHTDHSEPNTEAPLLSISLGQSAIFLMGGQSKAIKPQAILLRHGDVVIMNQESRLSYHAVPKIIQDEHISPGWDEETRFVSEYLQNHRINVNVRQVF
nr:nucleic acid dioxygenase ALKBH1-like [Lepeophtheirus salmonis]